MQFVMAWTSALLFDLKDLKAIYNLWFDFGGVATFMNWNKCVATLLESNGHEQPMVWYR